MSYKRQIKMLQVKALLDSLYEIVDDSFYEGIETTPDNFHLQRPDIDLIEDALESYKNFLQEKQSEDK